MLKENYLNRIKNLPDTTKQLGGLVFIVLVIIFSFSNNANKWVIVLNFGIPLEYFPLKITLCFLLLISLILISSAKSIKATKLSI